jgi:oligopeptide transport system permease protein
MAEPVRGRIQHDPTLPSRSLNYAEANEGAASGSLLTAEEARAGADTAGRSLFKDALRRFLHNWPAVISLVIIALLIVVAILAPFLHASNPYSLDYNALSDGPSPSHWFGTDPEGRDEYTRILFGLRVPLLVSFIATFFTVALGVAFGLAAGFYGKWIDSILSRFTDLMFAFPPLLLIIIIVTLFGPWFDANFPNGVGRSVILTAVFALVSWPPLMRFVRSLALSLKEQQFIEAARTVGTSGPKIIIRHLAPNVWGLVLVQAALIIAGIISFETLLSILGLGVTEPTPDLGAMLYDGYTYMDANGWGLFFPCIFVMVLIVAFIFVGNGIRDAVDPRSRH